MDGHVAAEARPIGTSASDGRAQTPVVGGGIGQGTKRGSERMDEVIAVAALSVPPTHAGWLVVHLRLLLFNTPSNLKYP
jgi:hypothetical protein